MGSNIIFSDGAAEGLISSNSSEFRGKGGPAPKPEKRLAVFAVADVTFHDVRKSEQ
jgi:hypothetical protein